MIATTTAKYFVQQQLYDGFINKYAVFFGQQLGWQRLIIAFSMGVIATLSLPPVYFIAAIYLSFPVLCWLLINVTTKKQAFLIGWIFAFGYFSASLYWISFALLVYSQKLWWLVPFAALGLPAVLSIYGGLATIITIHMKTGFGRALALALFWWLGEWLRGHMFTGFPWNLIGQSWSWSDASIQIASIIGIYGVTLLALLSASMLAALPYLKGKMRIGLIIFIIFLPLSSHIYGMMRLANLPVVEKYLEQDVNIGTGIGIRLVQGNIPQNEKWQRNLQKRNFERYLSLSQENRPEWINIVVWPETAASFFLEDAPLALEYIKNMLGKDMMLITGAPRKEILNDDYNIYNGVVIIDDKGKIRDNYNKSHLVPFGEYMPYGDILPFDKITHGKKDYTQGIGARTLNIGSSIPLFSPLVCYEVIFSGAVVNQLQKPDWLLNLTSDAWYGETAGPYQHMDITKLRAIEEGMPLIRVASTGISVAFDAYGREISSLKLNKMGIIDLHLPKRLFKSTYYSIHGKLLIWLIFFAFILSLLYVERDQKIFYRINI